MLEASENGGNFTEAFLRGTVDTFVLAGHDTPSALQGATYCLARYPEAQERARAELDGIFGAGNGERGLCQGFRRKRLLLLKLTKPDGLQPYDEIESKGLRVEQF